MAVLEVVECSVGDAHVEADDLPSAFGLLADDVCECWVFLLCGCCAHMYQYSTCVLGVKGEVLGFGCWVLVGVCESGLSGLGVLGCFDG